MFQLLNASSFGRRGRLQTSHGSIDTPFFLPVATAGAMKGITFDELLELGAQVLLCNTYHLHIQPGEKIVEEAGGLHRFIGWDKPILTDSGGFQVFSLSNLRKVTDDGVTFYNHRNGDELFLGPIESIAVQHRLGADILMCFDECPPSTAARAEQIKAVDRTLKWARTCKDVHEELRSGKRQAVSGKRAYRLSPTAYRYQLTGSVAPAPLLFGIVQGGLERDLREKCAQELIAIGFDGYAVGGLAVGETENEMHDILDVICPLLPEDKPRYLMGVGELHQQRKAIAQGIDMFDCVAAMREARHGTIWLSNGTKIRIVRSEFQHDHSPIDPESPSQLSRKHLKSYLWHLMKLGERYGETIGCMQNMGVTLCALQKLRGEMDSLRS